jgi:hypothetical protein
MVRIGSLVGNACDGHACKQLHGDLRQPQHGCVVDSCIVAFIMLLLPFIPFRRLLLCLKKGWLPCVHERAVVHAG